MVSICVSLLCVSFLLSSCLDLATLKDEGTLSILSYVFFKLMMTMMMTMMMMMMVMIPMRV